MLEGGPAISQGVFLLPDHHLHSLLHVGHRFVGLLLAGCQRRSGQSLPGSDHFAHHGHPDDRYQQLATARLLHKGKVSKSADAMVKRL